MKNSLKEFMKKFPVFLNKNNGSNFYKSSYVINENFKGFYNDLFIVHNQHRLNKNILFWRESERIQRSPLDEETFDIDDTYFVYAYYPNIKKVELYENNYLIDSRQYQEEDEQNEYSYSWHYISRTIDNGQIYEMTSHLKYRIKITTYDEYVIEKGYPENDVEMGDVFDHDKSIDDFGALYNIPRKKYTYTNTTNPEKTEPPFNNRSTEDDYHYLNRILYYISRFQNTPLPVLEVWKLYGIPIDKISFVNRSHQLCKMYEEKIHPDTSWLPKEWEHKDSMFCPQQELAFFFVTLNNYTPTRKSNIYFSFDFFDMYGKELEKTYLIDVYLNDTLITEDWNPENKYKFNTGQTQEYDLKFKFIAKPVDETHKQLESEEFYLTIKGCGNADFYCDAVNGNDITGNGSSQYPFKTLGKALSMVEANKNTIALKSGVYEIPDEQVIEKNTSIVGCQEATIKSDTVNFFKIKNNISLYLEAITLQYEENELYSDGDLFYNTNINENPVYIRIVLVGEVFGVKLVVYDDDGNILDEKVSWQLNDTILLEGKLLNRYGGTNPIKDELIEFYINKED